eukprot:COSAG02_NODE_57241_length_281_cov_0.857143_1_plen_73_part_10
MACDHIPGALAGFTWIETVPAYCTDPRGVAVPSLSTQAECAGYTWTPDPARYGDCPPDVSWLTAIVLATTPHG